MALDLGRAFRRQLRPRRPIELVFLLLEIAAIFHAAISQRGAELLLVGVVEGDKPIIHGRLSTYPLPAAKY